MCHLHVVHIQRLKPRVLVGGEAFNQTLKLLAVYAIHIDVAVFGTLYVMVGSEIMFFRQSFHQFASFSHRIFICAGYKSTSWRRFPVHRKPPACPTHFHPLAFKLVPLSLSSM